MEKEFFQLVKKNQGIIHKVCSMYADDVEDKRDLFQEILIQLWKSFASFRNEAKITTWMYKVALNTAISYFRKKNRKPRGSSLNSDEFQIADDTYDFEYEEKVKILKEAIGELNKIEKAIVMLYLEDKSYEEIADTMGITQNNLRVKINRIKSKLKLIVTKR